MRLLFLLVPLFICSSCLETENSSTLDPSIYADISGSAEFLAARSILATNCKNCHSFHAMTEDELIAAGDVIIGNAEGSPLYYRLSGSTGTGGPKNMPTGGALGVDEIEVIRTWILNITP